MSRARQRPSKTLVSLLIVDTKNMGHVSMHAGQTRILVLLGYDTTRLRERLPYIYCCIVKY